MSLSYQIKNVIRAYLLGSDGREPKDGFTLKMHPYTRGELSVTPEYSVRFTKENDVTFHWERCRIIDDTKMQMGEFTLLTSTPITNKDKK